jgi:hypothetical protein
MDSVLPVATVMIVVLAATPAIAHALELPGKMRLDRDSYFVVQRIYYPGFTVAGIAEIVAIVATVVLLLVAPTGMPAWTVLAALVGLLAMHALYWVLIHPVNRHWMEGEMLAKAGGAFFAADPLGMHTGARGRTRAGEPDWRALRNRWEYAHVARAALSMLSLLALVAALRG